MKKAFIIIFSLILFLGLNLKASAETGSGNSYILKDMFVPIQPVKTLSTSVHQEGDTVFFIVPSDLWIGENKVIPKNSIIKATIVMLKMPITGVNAAMKIDSSEIKFPNGNVYEIKGSVSYKGETKIGGTLTPPLSYNKALHYRKGEYYNGVVAQYVPSGEYEFGQHITIKPNEMLQLILKEDFIPY